LVVGLEACSAIRRIAASGGRLEELDRVSGWIVDEDLLAAGTGDDVVSPPVGDRCS
jgi:hypothetical protein